MFFFFRETLGFILLNLFDITLVSLAWLALQIPVITGPGATVAVYHFARMALLQDDARIGDFVQGLRQYFLKAWLIVAPLLLILVVLSFDVVFFLSGDHPWARVWASVPMAVLSALLVTQSYVFVLFVRERGSLQLAVRKAYLLAVSNLIFTMAVLMITLFYLLALYVTRIGLAIIFVGPVAILQTRAVHFLLRKQGIEF